MSTTDGSSHNACIQEGDCDRTPEREVNITMMMLSVRQTDAEGRAVIQAGALYRDRPAMRVDNVLGNGEAQAETAVRTRHAAVTLPETFEDVRQQLWRQPHAIV